MTSLAAVMVSVGGVLFHAGADLEIFASERMLGSLRRDGPVRVEQVVAFAGAVGLSVALFSVLIIRALS